MPLQMTVDGKQYSKLSTLVKDRRKALGLTQRQVADALGIKSPDFISLVEAGTRTIAYDRCRELAAVLKVNSKDLLFMMIAENNPGVAEILATGKLSRSGLSIREQELELVTRMQRLPRPARKVVTTMVDQLLAAHERTGEQE